jgi:hypothetical protein
MVSPERFHLPTPEKSDPDTEQQAKQLLDEVDHLIGQAKTKDDYTAIQEKLSALERLYAPETQLETALNIKEQYESQHTVLQHTGILELLSSGQEGIKGIDGQEYPFPSYEDIQERITTKETVLEKKAEQGFTKLLIVPFGMSLDTLSDKYKDTIIKHHNAGNLLATKADPSDPDEPLKLDEDTPLWIREEYKDADTNGTLVYHPEAFDRNSHQGKTKQQIIEEHGAWTVLLLEDLPNIPREGQGETKGGRAQLEANRTPREYLEHLQHEEAYRHEQGLTPEDHIMYAITYLFKTNQVIDDFQGKGSISYNMGGYFPTAGNVPLACWSRGHRRAGMGRNDPAYRVDHLGARSAVGV